MKFLKIGCGGILSLFVVLVLIGSLIGDDEATTNNANDTNAQASKEKETPKETVIGEFLTVDDVQFKVNSVEEVTEISAANGFVKYAPDAEGAIYLLVNVTVQNDGKQMINTDSSYFKLLSADGVKYSPTIILAADEKFFNYEGINPGLSVTGNVVFEVPSGLSDLVLQVQTGAFGTKKDTIKLQ